MEFAFNPGFEPAHLCFDINTDGVKRWHQQQGNEKSHKHTECQRDHYWLQKRRLKLEGSRHDGDIEYLELLGSRGEGVFEVRDQHLTDDEIGQLQQALNAHLATEWS